MRNEVFVYLEIYSVYLEIYEYGEVVQGVRFPDDCGNLDTYRDNVVVFLLVQYSSSTISDFQRYRTT